MEFGPRVSYLASLSFGLFGWEVRMLVELTFPALVLGNVGKALRKQLSVPRNQYVKANRYRTHDSRISRFA